MVEPDAYLDLQPKDEKLIGSLHTIKSSIKSIWVPNVRIIKDFTDHGMDHSDRVLNHAASLLAILRGNTDRDLTDVERYLLLASGYLHDIGMQCDIIKFPHIKKVAESFGADFSGADFSADFSSNYSSEAQNKIRENHQYLTAAWIHCAYENRNKHYESGLDNAAKLINPLLVQNLMEICMYHSKLPIDWKFSPCRLDKNTRIPLIAAILRFADELDVDLYRVPEGIYKNFRLPSRNIKYWWLHERTHIYLDSEPKRRVIEGRITFEVLLHPDDIEKCGNSVQEIVINSFKNKNKDLLKILASNDIPISFSDESVVSGELHLERIPKEILEALFSIEKY